MAVLTAARSAIARAGATRSGYPIAQGVVVPLYALSGVARSGAIRSNYHSPKVAVSVGGVQRGYGRAATTYKVWNLVVTDTLNSEPNTATFLASGFVPTEGAEVIITLGSTNNLWRHFGGRVISYEKFDLGDAAHTQAYSVRVIDYTWGLNKRKVIGHYTGSASTIAASLISTYASGYTSANVEAGMPTVDGGITFTNEDLTTCLTRLMKRVGGDWYCDYRSDVHAFLTDTFATGPTTLNTVHHSLANFKAVRDLSQVVTRCYVEGGGGAAFSAVAVGETVLPVTDANWYQATGGTVVCGPQRITYTSRTLGGGGGLVGPGAAPSGAPALTPTTGAGVEDGVHLYAVTFVTAEGESIPGPTVPITIGVTVAPTTAPTAADPTIGTGPNPGSHDYAVTFVTASGETTAGPSVTKATTLTPAPTTTLTPGAALSGGSVDAGDHDYAVTFVTSIGETTPSPISAQGSAFVEDPPGNAPAFLYLVTGGALDIGFYHWVVTFVTATGETTPSPVSGTCIVYSGPDLTAFVIFPVGGDNVTARKLYRRFNGLGSFQLVDTIADNVTTSYSDGKANAELGAAAPTSNTATVNTIPLTNIPLGDANVTSRKLYRRSGGLGLKLLDTIANNTATTYTDTTANAALGAAVPATNTAYLQRIALSDIPTGGALVTERNVWRTEAGGGQLKLLVNLPDNTTTVYADAKTDAQLGGNVPVANTATANQVVISSVPIGSANVTQRKIYRTVAGGSQLKLQQTIANNTATTGVTDVTADGALSTNVPTSDTSGLTQTDGHVISGSTTIIVANTGAFISTGGWAVVGNGEQVIRYTGITGTSLTGIPASGVGAIVASIGYNSTITAAPELRGIPASGAGSILYTILRGDDVNLLVQVDDTAAQTALAALIGGDGIQEDYIQDRRLAHTEATARGQAQVDLKGSTEVGVTYTSRDINTRSGRVISVNLGGTVGVTDDFLIQHVTISGFGLPVPPTFSVQASSERYSFEELLRQLGE